MTDPYFDDGLTTADVDEILSESPWKQMKSVPRDGTCIILFLRNGEVVVGRWTLETEYSDKTPECDWFINDSDYVGTSWPIAWMKIPELPRHIPRKES